MARRFQDLYAADFEKAGCWFCRSTLEPAGRPTRILSKTQVPGSTRCVFRIDAIYRAHPHEQLDEFARPDR